MKVWKLEYLPNDVVDAWNSYSSYQSNSSPFMSYGYSLAANSSGRNVFVLVNDDDDCCVKLLPFEYSSVTDRILNVATRVGAEMNDRMGIIGEANGEIFRQIFSQFSAFRINHYQTEPFIHQECLMADQKSGLGTDTTNHLDEYWREQNAQCKQRFSNLRNRKAKIEREIGALRATHSNLIDESDLQLIISEKRRQYKESGVFDIFSKQKNVRILKKITEMQRSDCLPFLSKLYAGNDLIAMHFGIRNKEYIHYWFPVYFLPFKIYSPGLLLIENIINNSSELGIGYIDYGEDAADYKSMFANSSYSNTKQFFLNNSIVSLAAKFKEAIGWRVANASRGLFS